MEAVPITETKRTRRSAIPLAEKLEEIAEQINQHRIRIVDLEARRERLIEEQKKKIAKLQAEIS